MMAASPAQNASGAIPDLGTASLAMKSNRTGAIFSPWASTRFMMGFLVGNGRFWLLLTRQQQNAPIKSGFRGPISPKIGPVRSPLNAYQNGWRDRHKHAVIPRLRPGDPVFERRSNQSRSHGALDAPGQAGA